MPQFAKTLPVAGTPIKLSDVTINCRHITMIACYNLGGPTLAPNSGMVFVGFSPNPLEQPLEFNPNDQRDFAAAAGQMFDLSQYYISADTAGDGLVILYQ